MSCTPDNQFRNGLLDHDGGKRRPTGTREPQGCFVNYTARTPGWVRGCGAFRLPCLSSLAVSKLKVPRRAPALLEIYEFLVAEFSTRSIQTGI
jgi:hypothetical protein